MKIINTKKIDEIVFDFIENIILKSTVDLPLWNSENRIFSKKNKWNYIDACMIKAIISVFEVTGDTSLLNYAKDFIDKFITSDFKIKTLDIKTYNLDNINGGKNLIYFYKVTNDSKYLRTIEWLYNTQIKTQPRLKCGSFWHKMIYPMQVWLDGAYMALPFMAEYAEIIDDNSINEDIINQLNNIKVNMRDKKTGLYYHGYDENRAMFWANSATGLSSEFWLRSIGWLLASLVDIYEVTKNESLKKQVSDMFLELQKAMATNQDETGMLYQVLNKPYLEGNYPETSGTLLFAYSSIKATRLGLCSEEVRQQGEKAFNGVCDNYIKWENNRAILKNICLVAGLGGESRRDGSLKYYLNEIVVENDAKGLAPFIMAWTELKRCEKCLKSFSLSQINL